uniref:eIF-4F 25 kDa subunit n=1 Tax=Romanomermis culicivorax TaxID=13658 RepID=A0A915KKE5_ROMCU
MAAVEPAENTEGATVEVIQLKPEITWIRNYLNHSKRNKKNRTSRFYFYIPNFFWFLTFLNLTFTPVPISHIYQYSQVEQFWRVYSRLKRPSDVSDKVEFHMFKKGIKPAWEDEANRSGGKWIIRLKKGLASRIWENLILAMLGEQFMVGDEICGAVCSIRNQEDIVSLWNKTASEPGITNRIRDTMRRILNLPPNTIIEYKRHDDCLKDQRSYRNTDVFRQ